jgi:di/tricarboxylate transporter
MGWEAVFSLLVIVGILFSLAREVAAPAFIFMTGLAALLLAGVLSPREAFSGFSNPAVVTVGALFIIAAGVQKTRALAFAERFIFTDRGSPRAVMLRMMGSVAFLSAFFNNTPIVAMLLPQVQDWAERTGNAASRLLIPLSYAAISGGVVTLIGTSTNLIVSGMLEDRGLSPLGFFDLAWIGLPSAALTFVWFATFGYHSLPDHRKRKTHGSSNGEAYQFDLKIPSDSPLCHQTVEEAGLRALDEVFLLHVTRNRQTVGPIGPEFMLAGEDILTFAGNYRAVNNLARRKQLEPNVPALEGVFSDLGIFEAVVASSSPLVGKTLKRFGFREHYRGVVVGIQRRDELLRGALGQIEIKTGDLLLIEANEGFQHRWNVAKDHFYLVTKRGDRDLPAEERASIALLILAGVVVPALLGLMPIVVTAFAGAILMVLSGCVRLTSLSTATNLPILAVIAAAIGVGQAMDSSGLAEAAAGVMLGVTAGSGVLFLVLGIYVVTNTLTEVITNNAAAVLMVPLAISAALSAGMDPHAAAVTVAVAASASFVTPIGYQTNLMVMSAGGYAFKDYFKAGLPVTLIFLMTTVLMVWARWL